MKYGKIKPYFKGDNMENQPAQNHSVQPTNSQKKREVPDGFVGTPDYYTDGKQVFISREFMQHMIESDPILASGIFAKKLNRQSMKDRILNDARIEKELSRMFAENATDEDKESVAILNQLLAGIKRGDF